MFPAGAGSIAVPLCPRRRRDSFHSDTVRSRRCPRDTRCHGAHAGRRASGNRYLSSSDGWRPLPANCRCCWNARLTTSRRPITPTAPAIAAPLAKPQIAEQFVRAGYVVAIQDCRGRYGSEGASKNISARGRWFRHDRLAARPDWCDGRIGTYGLSYGAHTQAALAALDPPGWRPCSWIRAAFPAPFTAASARAAPLS